MATSKTVRLVKLVRMESWRATARFVSFHQDLAASLLYVAATLCTASSLAFVGPLKREVGSVQVATSHYI